MTNSAYDTEILDNLSTAILLIKKDLTVIYVNNAAESLLENSRSKMIGTSIKQLFHELSDSEQQLYSAITHNKSFTKREAQLFLNKQKTITVDYGISPIFDKNDQLDKLIIELHPLDRLLKISRDEDLLNTHQASQALVRNLAHEIKNPLGGLRGAAQLLARQLPDKALNDYTDIIISEADRLTKLVDNLLGSNSLLKFQTHNIHEILEHVKQLIEAECNHSIKINRDYDPSLPELTADHDSLVQIFLNISRNAMQALLSDAENKAPSITIKTRILRQFTIGTLRHRHVCHIEIIDNGPGIPTEMINTIFLPMVSGKALGNGLGLSIAQSLANHHQGLIECQSKAGKTCFSIYLPLEQQV